MPIDRRKTDSPMTPYPGHNIGNGGGSAGPLYMPNWKLSHEPNKIPDPAPIIIHVSPLAGDHRSDLG